MFPGSVFLSLKVISAHLVFAVLDHAFDLVTTTQQLSQPLQRSIFGGIAESVGSVAIAFDPQRQPFLMGSNVGLLIIPNPHSASCKAIFQHAPLGGANTQMLPEGVFFQPYLLNTVRAYAIHDACFLWLGSFLARLGFWDAHDRSLQVDP